MCSAAWTARSSSIVLHPDRGRAALSAAGGHQRRRAIRLLPRPRLQRLCDLAPRSETAAAAGGMAAIRLQAAAGLHARGPPRRYGSALAAEGGGRFDPAPHILEPEKRSGAMVGGSHF
jgi:hypothetical protein